MFPVSENKCFGTVPFVKHDRHCTSTKFVEGDVNDHGEMQMNMHRQPRYMHSMQDTCMKHHNIKRVCVSPSPTYASAFAMRSKQKLIIFVSINLLSHLDRLCQWTTRHSQLQPRSASRRNNVAQLTLVVPFLCDNWRNPFTQTRWHTRAFPPRNLNTVETLHTEGSAQKGTDTMQLFRQRTVYT